MSNHSVGDKIKFHAKNTKGNDVWLTGKVQAVKRFEEPSGKVLSVNYIIDTGKYQSTEGENADPQPIIVELESEHVKAP